MGRKRLRALQEVLVAIQNWIVENGVSPTLLELRDVLKVGSTRTVFRYLEQLKKEGFIERWDGARGLRLLKRPNTGLQTVSVRLLGRAPAGSLMEVEETFEGMMRLPKNLLKPSGAKFFLLRVVGTSMNRAKVEGKTIEDGDLVLVQQQANAEPKQIVVVNIDGQATIKRFMRGPGYFFLMPDSSDPKHEPIMIEGEARIQGVLRRVFKKGAEILDADDGDAR